MEIFIVKWILYSIKFLVLPLEKSSPSKLVSDRKTAEALWWGDVRGLGKFSGDIFKLFDVLDGVVLDGVVLGGDVETTDVCADIEPSVTDSSGRRNCCL